MPKGASLVKARTDVAMDTRERQVVLATQGLYLIEVTHQKAEFSPLTTGLNLFKLNGSDYW